jgi:hypothetical protein
MLQPLRRSRYPTGSTNIPLVRDEYEADGDTSADETDNDEDGDEGG